MGTQHTFSVVLCAVAVTLQRQRGAVPAETVRTFMLLAQMGRVERAGCNRDVVFAFGPAQSI